MRDIGPQPLQIVQADASCRWQNGWLIGQGTAGVAGQPPPEAFVLPALPASGLADKQQPYPGLQPLQRAVANARQFILASNGVEDKARLELLSKMQTDLQGDLTQAKQDPASRDEAEALERMS